MKLTVIVTQENQIVGATTEISRPRAPGDRLPTAQLIAGPGQRLVEVEVPDHCLPHRSATPAETDIFLKELKKLLRC